jgi:hypothetical protein
MQHSCRLYSSGGLPLQPFPRVLNSLPSHVAERGSADGSNTYPGSHVALQPWPLGTTSHSGGQEVWMGAGGSVSLLHAVA